jgi:hypothetical protein
MMALKKIVILFGLFPFAVSAMEDDWVLVGEDSKEASPVRSLPGSAPDEEEKSADVGGAVEAPAQETPHKTPRKKRQRGRAKDKRR